MRLYPLQRKLRDYHGLVELHGHHVYLPAISGSSLVVDAGGHRGQFSRALLERVSCRVIALEPNPDLPRDPGLPSSLEWLPAALAPAAGQGRLRVSRDPQSSSLRQDLVIGDDLVKEQAVELTTIAALRSRTGDTRIALLKLDIEGTEIPLLAEEADTTLRAVDQITVEFHSFFGLAEEKAHIRAVSNRLRSLGFLRLHASAPAEHESDVLFININSVSLPLGARLHLAIVEPAFTLLRRIGGATRSWVRRHRSGDGGP